MKNKTNYILCIFCLSLWLPRTGLAQTLSPEGQAAIGAYLTKYARSEISVGKITIDSVVVDKNKLFLFMNENASNISFRQDNVNDIYKGVSALLPKELTRYKLQLVTDNHPIEALIPLALREKSKRHRELLPKRFKPLVTPLSVPYNWDRGLKNRHIALWQSHGYYYEQSQARWQWQRARIFQTVEDLYTQSYVLPFLVPMLENAGANVLIPRERDFQTYEVVVDNDGCRNASRYLEKEGTKQWQTGREAGFAHLRAVYTGFENPFREGTYRQIESATKGRESVAEWIPQIPEKGRYAVYVSYKTLPQSTTDARYTVYHKGGSTSFSVNQQMGGGTWIYLGHFSFDEGVNDTGKVTLSNYSSKSGQMVTADAVKIGGGYGNIARRVSEDGRIIKNRKSSDNESITEVKQLPDIEYPCETSGYPRFTEASRYWLQWAGIPDSIYSESNGKNDYTDDYKSRGMWVNYIAGGSKVNPGEAGLNIPVDLSLAFHTDAGTTLNDSIIGTLGIFHTYTDNGVYPNGVSRYAARDLTDLVRSTIVNDIRELYEPKWTCRGLWNKSYYEARVPKVPAMLLELLSHQNFADMRYGLDPRFRFTVSRAIYKGMLQFICGQYGLDYVVQPLPVDHLSARFVGDDEIELAWQPVDDPLESTAKAEKYVVYTRVGDGDFDNGTVVDKNTYRMKLLPGLIYSYKIEAMNNGGLSFPSEIVSAAKAAREKGIVLVVNGFDRVCAPADFAADGIGGFCDNIDHGVPYKEDISYIGSMKEFRRSIPWMDDNASGFGDSYANYETQVIAGNSFDYPADHGKAILQSGYSFVSCSNEAVEERYIDLKEYKVVDLILGKQRETKIGRGAVPSAFKTFSKKMQEAIASYCAAGGNIFVSGAFVGSDLWDNPEATSEDKAFATDILKYKWRVNRAAIMGKVKSAPSPYPQFAGEYNYFSILNATSYVVEAPDGIMPSGEDAYTILRYSENNIGAGVAYKGDYKSVVLGFPFESLCHEDEKGHLMKAILAFFE